MYAEWNIQSFFVQRGILLNIQGRQHDICTKPITCPACGIHHLSLPILTEEQQGKTGRITLFDNWEKNSKQNKTTKPCPTPPPPKQKHAIILDVQFKDFWMLIFSRVCNLKLLKYGCHQLQLQEAETSAEQIISTHTARRKRGTFHTNFFMVATACEAWQKTCQKWEQIQSSRS